MSENFVNSLGTSEGPLAKTTEDTDPTKKRLKTDQIQGLSDKIRKKKKTFFELQYGLISTIQRI